jgi:hypothetical protein
MAVPALHRWRASSWSSQRSEETEAFLLAIPCCEVSILDLVVLFFQVCLWLEDIMQEFLRVVITVIGFTIEKFSIIGTFHLIACGSLNDTLPIPMLAIATLGVVSALAKVLPWLLTRCSSNNSARRGDGVSRTCNSRCSGALARIRGRNSGEVTESRVVHTNMRLWYQCITVTSSRIL